MSPNQQLTDLSRELELAFNESRQLQQQLQIASAIHTVESVQAGPLQVAPTLSFTLLDSSLELHSHRSVEAADFHQQISSHR